MGKSVGRLVSILYRKNQVYLNMALKQLNITASELPILLYLFHNDGVSQEELSSYLIIDKASTARVVQSLLQKGFIRKEKDIADRRANRVFLTEFGLNKRSIIREPLQQWSNYLTEGLDEESVNTMFTVLEKMVKKVEIANFREIWRNE
jgi:MarR family transcriptional regulator, organic hydroperoxide resistance regulator